MDTFFQGELSQVAGLFYWYIIDPFYFKFDPICSPSLLHLIFNWVGQSPSLSRGVPLPGAGPSKYTLLTATVLPPSLPSSPSPSLSPLLPPPRVCMCVCVCVHLSMHRRVPLEKLHTPAFLACFLHGPTSLTTSSRLLGSSRCLPLLTGSLSCPVVTLPGEM